MEGSVGQNDDSWFPRKIEDLDHFGTMVLEAGEQLTADHPGFTDKHYRLRRAKITEAARRYRHGLPIERIEYTAEENDTWNAVYARLSQLFTTHACRQLNDVMPLLEEHCGYGTRGIPQLEVVSQFLQKRTGWRIKPVAGLLTPREFLQSLAFRVSHSTQYIRHHTKPFYTPEPDVCHELLGHVPLFVDPAFADFSQEIGLAALGASDEDIAKLAHVYWFTVEFGLCKEDGRLKAYGAGLLSSIGELQWCLDGDKEKNTMPAYLPFDPDVAAVQFYSTTDIQPTYFVAESFQDVLDKIRSWVKTLQRSFQIQYDAPTHSVVVLGGVDPCSMMHVAAPSEWTVGCC